MLGFTDSVAFLPVSQLNKVLKWITNCCCKNAVVVNVKMSEVSQRSVCACCLLFLALVPQLYPCPDLLLCLAFFLGSSRGLREDHRNGKISTSVTFDKVTKWDKWECCTLVTMVWSEWKVKEVWYRMGGNYTFSQMPFTYVRVLCFFLVWCSALKCSFLLWDRLRKSL